MASTLSGKGGCELRGVVKPLALFRKREREKESEREIARAREGGWDGEKARAHKRGIYSERGPRHAARRCW
jgi:hypothetical protein